MKVWQPSNPQLDATKIPTEIDIAWAVGVYEGEGTCRSRKNRTLEVSVVQKDPEILFRLRDWFGGRVCDNGAGSGVHQWSIYGDRARIFLALSYGMLSSRRKKQVDVTNCFEFLCGRSPVGLSVDELKNHLLSFYEDHQEKIRLTNAATHHRNYVARRDRTVSKVVSIA